LLLLLLSQDMGFMSGEICSPEVAKCLLLQLAVRLLLLLLLLLLLHQDMGFTSAEICSPEVAKCLLGRGKLLKSDPSMDMWALGCILYQLATHRWGFR
jgi:serine/threonine protein kinase